MDYQKNGDYFLTETKTKMSVKFLKNDYHFVDDEKTRDIFKIKFSRNGKSFSLRFGQSINESTCDGQNPPSAYDVLACLSKYDIGDFENFCSEFGYDERKLSEYPKVMKIYKAVKKEYENTLMLWGDVIDKLRDIE